MQITDVRVRRVTQEGKTKAYCSVVFDGMLVIHDIRVMEGAHGIFASMPSRKNKEGEYKDLAHPITAEARAMIQNAVVNAYNDLERQDSISA